MGTPDLFRAVFFTDLTPEAILTPPSNLDATHPILSLDERWASEIRQQKEIPGDLCTIGRAAIARYGASE